MPSVEPHIEQFSHAPALVTADHGVHSVANERAARAAGVEEVVLPKPGKLSAKRTTYERQDWFRAGRNWRAGIAGRISGLKRSHGLRRCRYHGTDGMNVGSVWHARPQSAPNCPPSGGVTTFERSLRPRTAATQRDHHTRFAQKSPKT